MVLMQSAWRDWVAQGSPGKNASMRTKVGWKALVGIVGVVGAVLV